MAMRKNDPWRYTRFEAAYLFFGLITLVLLAWFAVLMWFKRRLNIERWWFKPWLWPLVLFAAGFLIADVLYQITIGSLLFGARPRHWLFTDRLQDLDGRDDRMLRFKQVLNEHDTGHV